MNRISIFDQTDYQKNELLFNIESACFELNVDSDVKIIKLINEGLQLCQYKEPDYACSFANNLKLFHLKLNNKINSLESNENESLSSIIRIIEIGIDKFERIIGVIKHEHQQKRQREESNENEPNKRRKIINNQETEVKNNSAAAAKKSQEDAEMKAAEEIGDLDMELAKKLMECDNIEGLNAQFNIDMEIARKHQEDADMEMAMQLQELENDQANSRNYNSNSADGMGNGSVVAAEPPPRTETLEEYMNAVTSVKKTDFGFFL